MIAALLFFIAGVANAVQDKLSHHYSTSIFKNMNELYWNPLVSWRAKYIEGNPSKGRKKFIGIVVPTLFSDGWHLFKSIMLTSIVVGAAIGTDYAWYWNILLYRMSFGLAFWLFYNHLLARKNKS